MDKYTAPDLTSSALITIDTQCDTLDGQPFEIQGTSGELNRRIDAVITGINFGCKKRLIFVLVLQTHDQHGFFAPLQDFS